jgi:hypothetical protein
MLIIFWYDGTKSHGVTITGSLVCVSDVRWCPHVQYTYLKVIDLATRICVPLPFLLLLLLLLLTVGPR